MPQHDDVGAGFEHGQRGRDLPGLAAQRQRAPGGGHALGHARLLLPPRLLAEVADHRLLGHGVAHQRGQAQALHDRVGVLDAVAQRARVGVHEHAVERQPHVADENVELLGEIDVDGGEGDDEMAVAEGGRDDRAVVLLFAQTQRQPLALGGLGDRHEHLVVFFGHAGAVDDQGHAHGAQHRLHGGHAVLGRGVTELGVGAAQAQGDQVGAGLDGLGRPGGRVAGDALPGRRQLGRPHARVDVVDLDGERRAVRIDRLEAQERQRLLAAHRHGLGAAAAVGGSRAQRHLSDRARPGLNGDLHCFGHRLTPVEPARTARPWSGRGAAFLRGTAAAPRRRCRWSRRRCARAGRARPRARRPRAGPRPSTP